MDTPAQPLLRFLAPGDKLGKYVVIRQLAVGGMAELYLMRTVGIEGFEKLVCVKRILPQYIHDPQVVAMFLNEARLAATLHHANIAQVYDIGQEHGEYFIAMEYVHGEDLGHMVIAGRENGVPISLDCALALAAGLCAGLHYAHDKAGPDGKPLGVVHRDVSPSNVLVSYDGAVKLVDFGIAGGTGGPSTSQNNVRGKVAYMSPEQCRGRAPIDRRSDVFSIGTILYELTTGQLPFLDDNEYGVLHQIVNRDAAPPSTLVPGYPAALEAIVMRALARDPDRRYATALELQHALEDYAHANRLRVSALVLARLMSTLFPARLEEWDDARAQGAFFVEQHVVRTLIESGKTGDNVARYTPPPSESGATATVRVASSPRIEPPGRAGGEPRRPSSPSQPPASIAASAVGFDPPRIAAPVLTAPPRMTPQSTSAQGRMTPHSSAAQPRVTPHSTAAQPRMTPQSTTAQAPITADSPTALLRMTPHSMTAEARTTPHSTTAQRPAPSGVRLPGLPPRAGSPSSVGGRSAGRPAPVPNMPGAVPIFPAIAPRAVAQGGTLVSNPAPTAPAAPRSRELRVQHPDESGATNFGRDAHHTVADLTERVRAASARPTQNVRAQVPSRRPFLMLALFGLAGAGAGVWFALRTAEPPAAAPSTARTDATSAARRVINAGPSGMSAAKTVAPSEPAPSSATTTAAASVTPNADAASGSPASQQPPPAAIAAPAAAAAAKASDAPATATAPPKASDARGTATPPKASDAAATADPPKASDAAATAAALKASDAHATAAAPKGSDAPATASAAKTKLVAGAQETRAKVAKPARGRVEQKRVVRPKAEPKEPSWNNDSPFLPEPTPKR